VRTSIARVLNERALIADEVALAVVWVGTVQDASSRTGWEKVLWSLGQAISWWKTTRSTSDSVRRQTRFDADVKQLTNFTRHIDSRARLTLDEGSAIVWVSEASTIVLALAYLEEKQILRIGDVCRGLRRLTALCSTSVLRLRRAPQATALVLRH
jgi:hypothetical protein